MNHSDKRNKSLADYRQDQTSARSGSGFSAPPVALSTLTGVTIGVFIGGAVVVLVRAMESETDGTTALRQAMMILVPVIVLTVIARILHKRSKNERRVSKVIVMLGTVLGLGLGGVIWFTAPTQDGIAQQLRQDNMPLIRTRAEQLAACRAQIDDYPIGSLKTKITAAQLAEFKTVKMNLKRNRYRVSEGWNTLLTTDTDFARLKAGTPPDEVMDSNDRPKSSFRSPDVYSYSKEFCDDVEEIAAMAYGDPNVWPRRIEELVDVVVPMRYVIIIRMGDINPTVLTGKKYIAGYASGEAFCFELEKKRLIAAFSFETTNSTTVEYTFKKNDNVAAEASAAGTSLQEDLLKNTWPAFWQRFHSVATASVSSNQSLTLPFKHVALSEAKLNVVRTKIMDARREREVKAGLEAVTSGVKPSPKDAPQVTLTAEQKAEVKKLFAEKGKISAIKRYREITRTSLKDAKHAVEAMVGQ